MPVARPLDPKAPTPRKSKGRPLIIRSAPARLLAEPTPVREEIDLEEVPGEALHYWRDQLSSCSSSAHGAKKAAVFPEPSRWATRSQARRWTGSRWTRRQGSWTSTESSA